MNKLLRPLLYATLFMGSLVSCTTTDPEPANSSKIVFWSSNQNILKIKVDCYVDGKLIGTLKQVMTATPDCSDKNSPIASVEPGSHHCEFRAANNQKIELDLNTEKNQCYNVELE